MKTDPNDLWEHKAITPKGLAAMATGLSVVWLAAINWEMGAKAKMFADEGKDVTGSVWNACKNGKLEQTGIKLDWDGRLRVCLSLPGVVIGQSIGHHKP